MSTPHAAAAANNNNNPQGPMSPQAEKDAARAMSSADAWKPPAMARRQSYKKEDEKRELQMTGIRDDQAAGPGFSETRGQ